MNKITNIVIASLALGLGMTLTLSESIAEMHELGNRRPALLGPFDDRFVVAGDELVFYIQAEDPDQDLLTFSVVTPLFGAEFQTTILGDGTGDGRVELPDFNGLRSSIFSRVGDPNYNPWYDFNSDGAIGIPDFNFFRRNYGKSIKSPEADFAGRFAWAPVHDEAGIYTVLLSVSDGQYSDSGYVTITVTTDGCSLDSGLHSETLVHDDLVRSYELYVPTGCASSVPMPLVFDFHGSNGTASEQADLSGLRSTADLEGFVVVHPNGENINGHNNWNAFNGQVGGATADDVGFVLSMINKISAELPIDSERVYVTGHSSGGALSHLLACNVSGVIAAAVPVAMQIGDYMDCDPAEPIPVLEIHGLSDNSVPYEGAPDWVLGAIYSSPESAAFWASLNNCGETPIRTHLASQSFMDIYSGCSDQITVGLVSIEGHHFIYNNSEDLVVRDLIWDFLSQHTLNP